MYDQLHWEIGKEKLDIAINLMVQLQPYPSAIRPYISLRIDYKFEFVDLETKKNLENQEEKSHLSIFLTKNSSVMPELNDLSNYLNLIEDCLPFKKLDRNSFRLIEPNKTKTKNVIRKVEFY